MRIKFDKDSLVVEENSYGTKIVNAYIVFDLDTCQKTLVNNFELKKLLVRCD